MRAAITFGHARRQAKATLKHRRYTAFIRLTGEMGRDKDSKYQRDRAESLVFAESRNIRRGALMPHSRANAGCPRRDMRAEPQRPDRHKGRDQSLPRVRCPCDRPRRASHPDEADRKCPDGIDLAGIASALLHHPGARHQDRKRQCDRRQRRKIGDRQKPVSNRLSGQYFVVLRARCRLASRGSSLIPSPILRDRPFLPGSLCHIGLEQHLVFRF